MNGTTLKFGKNRAVPIHPPWIVAVGLAWVLTGGYISSVDAFKVSECLPVINNPINPPDEAREVATKVSKELETLLQDDDALAERLGFIDPREQIPLKPYQLMIKDQPPGPLAVFYVSLKALQDFLLPASSSAALSKEDYAISLMTQNENWSNLSKALVPRRFLYPITNANDRVASSVLVSQDLKNKGWKVIKFGSPKLTQALTNPEIRTSGLNYFAINIRSLNRWYLGWISGGEFWLKAIVDDPGFNFAKGKSLRAREVFLALQKEARTIDRKNPAPR